jgi:nitroreductase
MKRLSKVFYRAGMGLFAITILWGCASVERKSYSALIKRARMTAVPEYMTSLLGYASLAPSSHNAQPWKVRVLSDLEFIIQADNSRRLSQVDPDGRELMLSIGAFWENLEQAAAAMGLQIQSEILATTASDTDIIKIRLSRGELGDAKVLRLMEIRATDRKALRKKELDLEELKKVIPGHFNYFPRKSKEGEWLADSLLEANKKQAFDDAKQKELAEWLRFSRSQAAKQGDGLTAEGLGVAGWQRFFWYSFMKKKSALSRSFRNRELANVRKQVDNCAGFIVITSDDNSVAALLNAGREFERLSLACVAVKISLQPMSQLTEESPWKERIGSELGLTQPVQFVLRAGYAVEYPKPAIRREVKDFVYEAER